MTKSKQVVSINERRDSALAETMALRDSLAAGTHMSRAEFEEEAATLAVEFRAQLASLPGWLGPVLREKNNRPGLAAARRRITDLLRRPPSWHVK